MTVLEPPTPVSFWAGESAVEEVVSGVPRDFKDRPMIRPIPGEEHLAIKSKRSKHAGLIAYSRASSFGSILEDDDNLVRWQKRQVARGMALMYERAKLAPGPSGGLTLNPAYDPGEAGDRDGKRYWDDMATRAENEVGSYDKAEIGTKIHAATEAVDRGESLADWPELLRERATAYWRATREWGVRPTSIETFGVEDVNHVAGTWDRTGWYAGVHRIFDVKTSSTMDFAGIGFAVQLACYAHMSAYDPETGARTTHEEAFGVPMDLETAYIIHVDRNQGGPVELFKVDIATGWRWANLVDMVKKARNEGTKAIVEVEPDEVVNQIYRADSVDELRSLHAGLGALADRYATHFKEMAAWLRR